MDILSINLHFYFSWNDIIQIQQENSESKATENKTTEDKKVYQIVEKNTVQIKDAISNIETKFDNKTLLHNIGRDKFMTMRYYEKYGGGRIWQKIKRFGKRVYNKVIKPVAKVVKKIVDVAANNPLIQAGITTVGNALGSMVGVPVVGTIAANAIKGADTAIDSAEKIVTDLRNKKLNTTEIKNIMNTIKDQVQQAKQQLQDSKESKKLDEKVKTVENNLQVNKDNLNATDVNKAVAAGFIFYNPINKQVIPKYSGRINLGGRINLAGELNPKVWNLLKKPRGPKGAKIMPHYRVHNVPGQVTRGSSSSILSQVPEDINKTVANLNKESSGCKKSKVSKTGTKTNNKITSLDELRMKYSKI